MTDLKKLKLIARAIRREILIMTTKAKSGHPTSSLSAVEILTALFFGGLFKNYRFVLSKGHASPLLYALYWAGGKLSREDLYTYRTLGSPLEGHPTPRFSEVMVATGSLGQGLSIGLGMAWGIKNFASKREKVFVLSGDSELSEGSIWEAALLAPSLGLSNLIWLIDLNRLGQTGETLWGHDFNTLKKQLISLGWEVRVIKKGNNIAYCLAGLKRALSNTKPLALIFVTKKGAGVSFLEDKEGWHGKPLPPDLLEKALQELGEVSLPSLKVSFPNTDKVSPRFSLTPKKIAFPDLSFLAPRKSWIYGVLKRAKEDHILVLDAEVGNSTYTQVFQRYYPERFLQCYIAEQNMAGIGVGLAVLGFKVVMATFGAFWTRAFDHLRMAQYSDAPLLVAGTHPGVSIGKDGPSQMGLEDIAMFSVLQGSVILYPSDAISALKLAETALKSLKGITYLRLTRADLPQIYSPKERFKIGSLKLLRERGKVVLIGAGITLHEALRAAKELEKEHILCKVIDLYSVKPLPYKKLKEIVTRARLVVVAEDHYLEGGIGEKIKAHLEGVPVLTLAVRKKPRSGETRELLRWAGIDWYHIKKVVKRFFVV